MNKRTLIGIVVLAGTLVVVASVMLLQRPGHDLVVYPSADSAYSRPVVEAFERASGLRVGLVPDAEAAKTTGHIVDVMFKKAGIAEAMAKKEIPRSRGGGEMARGICEQMCPVSRAAA